MLQSRKDLIVHCLVARISEIDVRVALKHFQKYLVLVPSAQVVVMLDHVIGLD